MIDYEEYKQLRKDFDEQLLCIKEKDKTSNPDDNKFRQFF